MSVDLALLTVFSEQSSEDPLSPHPQHLGGHTGFRGTLSVCVRDIVPSDQLRSSDKLSNPLFHVTAAFAAGRPRSPTGKKNETNPPLTGTRVSTLALSLVNLPNPSPGVNDGGLLDDKTILVQLLDVLPRVGVGEVGEVLGVEVDLSLSYVEDGRC